jgi:hypothetical protein
VTASNPFLKTVAGDVDAAATRHGFRRKGARNWVRRTEDFIQLVNLQRSQWSADDHYLNFALWPLAMGEPPSIAESKFQFRTRGECLGAVDLPGFFAAADELKTLAALRDAESSGRVVGLMTQKLRALLP